MTHSPHTYGEPVQMAIVRGVRRHDSSSSNTYHVACAYTVDDKTESFEVQVPLRDGEEFRVEVDECDRLMDKLFAELCDRLQPWVMEMITDKARP